MWCHRRGRRRAIVGLEALQGRRGECVLGSHQERSEPVVGDGAVRIVGPAGSLQRRGAGRERVAPRFGGGDAGAGGLPRERPWGMDEARQRGIGDGAGHLDRPRPRHADDGHMEVRVRDVVEELTEAAAGERVAEVRGNLDGRLEHEPARRHPRVGDRQGGAGDEAVFEHELVIKKDVEIERPRAPALRPVTVERVLDRGEHAEELVRPELRLDQAGTVEERGLIGRATDRPGLAVSAHRPQRDAGHHAKELDGAIELFAPGPLIGTASDQAAGHVALPAVPAGGSPPRPAGEVIDGGRLRPLEEIVPRLLPHRQALPRGSHRPRCGALGGWSSASPSARRSPPIIGNVWQPVRAENAGFTDSPLQSDKTGKVGGTSRPRPRSSTFAPSCRRPPSSFPVARRSGQSSGCHRAQSSSLQETHHALGPRSWSGVARVPMRGNESKGRTSADQCRSIGESIVMRGGESLLRQA